MKTIFQKDLRENLKVALICLLIFTLVLVQAYESSIDFLSNLLLRNLSAQSNQLQPLLSNMLVLDAGFFCALFGAALGWFQTRNEAHRDLWAFLVHRPVTRTEIFLGKSAAGLCLYALGAGLPLAGLVLVASVPGSVAAPFEWRMALPLVELFLAGLAAYFAGLLTGLRQARWYISRALGLGLGIAALIGVYGYELPWHSWALLAATTGASALAAWGAYQTGGYYRGQPLAGKLGLIAAMTTGCSLVLFAAVGLFVALFLGPLIQRSFTNSYYEMTRDGTIYKATSHGGGFDEIEDLNGHPLIDPKTGRRMEQAEFSTRRANGPEAFTTFGPQSLGNTLRHNDSFFTLWTITGKTLWYLDRHGKFLGYDGRTRKCVGSLEAHDPDGASFLVRGDAYGYYYNTFNDAPRKFIATPKTVYLVDFQARTVQPVLTLTNDEIGGYQDRQTSYLTDAAGNFIFTTRTAVYLLDQEGRVVFKLPYEPGFANYPHVSLFRLDVGKGVTNRFVVWFHADYGKNAKSGWKMPDHIEWIGAAGQGVTQTLELRALHTEVPPDWTDKLADTLLPPAESLSEMAYEWHHDNRIGYPHREGVPLAVISAVIGWGLARRYHFPTAVALGWTGFVFLFGLVGLMVILCVQEWPARVSCPKCQKLRAVDLAACEHCGGPFPPPEKNGTEIFETLTPA